jgi:hypothetical protein
MFRICFSIVPISALRMSLMIALLTDPLTLVVTPLTCNRCLTSYTYNHLSLISWPSGGATASDYKIGGTTSFDILGLFPT